MIKLKNNIHIIIVSLMFVSSAQAERVSCITIDNDKNTKSVDLRKEMPPLRDQDSVGWCYGFAAADLLSHYLYKTQGKALANSNRLADYRSRAYSVSAMGVSNAYNEVKNPDYSKSIKGIKLSELLKLNKKVVPTGGTIREALAATKEKGLCFEKDLSSADFSYVEDSRCAIKNQCKIADVFNIIYDSPKGKLGCYNLNNIQKMFSGLDLKSIQKILENSAHENAFTNLVNATCKRRFAERIFDKEKGPVVKSLTLDNNHPASTLSKMIDENLEMGTPVGVMYYADFLSANVSTKKYAHASTIVGKRFNPKTCEVEYILRNSWGEGCGYYKYEDPRNTKCVSDLKQTLSIKDNDKKSAQAYFNGVLTCRKLYPELPRNPRVECEGIGSHLYIRKSDLEKNMYNVTALEEHSFFF